MHITGFIFLITLALPLATWGQTSEACKKTARAVIDLGSGTTKLTVAEVEFCQNRVSLLAILEDSQTVALPLEAGKDKAGRIPPPLQEKALSALKGLKEQALKTAKGHDHVTLDISIVGTHAFRTARNLSEFTAKIESLGIPVRALIQNEEARAGLAAVKGHLAAASCKAEELTVWDIGGGSMQLTSDTQIAGLALGAESFKEKVISKLKDKPRANSCAKAKESPNPLGKENVSKVRELAKQTAKQLLPSVSKKPVCIIGIGGVHTKAIDAQIDRQWSTLSECACASQKDCSAAKDGYTLKELECLAKVLAEKSDCDTEIAGPYSTTAVTNLFLVLGFLDHLEARKVQTAELNMGHAFVLDRELLKFQTFSTAP